MRILIVANGSFPIEDILTFSRQFISCSSDPPTLLTILNPGDDRSPCQNNTIADQARKFFRDQCLHTKTRIGQPVKEVVSEIQDGGYDLVILGDRRPRRLARIFKKSTAKRVAEQSACSVMIAQGKIGPIRRILLCDSGAEESQLLTKFALQIVDLLGREEEVTVLHVMSQISAGPGVRGSQLRADTDELIETHTPEGDLLERDIHSLEKSGLHSVPKVRHGLVVDEILAEARSGDYDLIVIGAQRQKWQRFLLADLSHQIIEQVDQPVLVVK